MSTDSIYPAIRFIPNANEMGMDGHSPGHWGIPTSTLDWCEENYIVSHYIAEFWNSLTNLGFICAGLWYARHISGLALPARFAVSFLLLTVVGVGSLAFHATLRYETQLMDEIPMLFAIAQVLYCQFARDDRYNAVLLFSIASPAASSLYYFWHNDPLVHQFMFGLMIILNAAAIVYKLQKRPSPMVAFLAYGSLGFFLVAFATWNVDNLCCRHLRLARGMLRPPLDVLLQLHGWWHMLSAMSAVWFMSAMMVAENRDRKLLLRFAYGLFPVLQISDVKGA